MLTSNSQASAWLFLQSSGVKCLCHHTQLSLFSFLNTICSFTLYASSSWTAEEHAVVPADTQGTFILIAQVLKELTIFCFYVTQYLFFLHILWLIFFLHPGFFFFFLLYSIWIHNLCLATDFIQPPFIFSVLMEPLLCFIEIKVS